MYPVARARKLYAQDVYGYKKKNDRSRAQFMMDTPMYENMFENQFRHKSFGFTRAHAHIIRDLEDANRLKMQWKIIMFARAHTRTRHAHTNTPRDP